MKIKFQHYGIVHDSDNLHFLYDNYEKNEKFWSDSGQDLFALMMNKGKQNGRYLEIGSREPIKKNNTYILEAVNGWQGISLDVDENYFDTFNDTRINKTILQDATTADYDQILEPFGWTDRVVDYLQVDCDPAPQSFAALKKIMQSEYKFGTITFEHDNNQDVAQQARDLLNSKGYVLAYKNVCAPKFIVDKPYIYEDWWVHPDLVDTDLIVETKNTKYVRWWEPFFKQNVAEYYISEKTEPWPWVYTHGVFAPTEFQELVAISHELYPDDKFRDTEGNLIPNTRMNRGYTLKNGYNEFFDSKNWNEVSKLLSFKMQQLLERLNLQAPENAELSVEFSCISPDFEYKTHPDQAAKWCSWIIFLDGDGNGTRLHKTLESEADFDVQWFPNRGVFFKRTDHSFHSFDSKGCSEVRRTLVLMLKTS
jgi:hypothetical protein